MLAPTLRPMTITQRLSDWLTKNQLAVDAFAVAIIGPVVVITSTDWAGGGSWRTFAPWAIAGIAPLSFRRHLPVASAIAVFTVSALQVIVGPVLIFPANLAVLVSLYTVTVYGPRWASRSAMGGVVIGAAVFTTRSVMSFGLPLVPEGLAFGSMIIAVGAAVWALALLRRERLAVMDALHDRAERLERERDQQAQIAVAAERARIAREMHDVVAHSLAIVIAQADGGRYAAREDPGVALSVLATISDTGRAALADVRRILGILRDDPVGSGSLTGPDPLGDPQVRSDGVADAMAEPAPRAPQPDTTDLAVLIERVRRAGLTVSLEDEGTPREVTPGLQLTVYRILQEALTNVLKHAGPDPTVGVVRRWSAERLVLEVVDDGRGAASETASSDSGLGLLGMRERVGLFGGTLHAGPRDGGGFRVRAELPVASVTPTIGSVTDD